MSLLLAARAPASGSVPATPSTAALVLAASAEATFRIRATRTIAPRFALFDSIVVVLTVSVTLAARAPASDTAPATPSTAALVSADLAEASFRICAARALILALFDCIVVLAVSLTLAARALPSSSAAATPSTRSSSAARCAMLHRESEGAPAPGVGVAPPRERADARRSGVGLAPTTAAEAAAVVLGVVWGVAACPTGEPMTRVHRERARFSVNARSRAVRAAPPPSPPRDADGRVRTRSSPPRDADGRDGHSAGLSAGGGGCADASAASNRRRRCVAAA